jgi:hypothetical protein
VAKIYLHYPLHANTSIVDCSIQTPNYSTTMSEDRRSRSRSRSRSPERGGEDNGDNNAAHDNGAPANDNNNAGGEDSEGVKLYVGNLDYGAYH